MVLGADLNGTAVATQVYLDYDQDGLDAQYNNRVRFPEYAEHFANWRTWSDQARAEMPVHLDVPFGDDPSERLDVFPAARRDAPIYIFIHGGYWYSLDKADYSYVARGMAPHGVMTVVPNHGLAPGYRMDEIVRQSRAALAWLWHHAADYGGDRERIYVAGHSAGGHLGMMQLGTDWPKFDHQFDGEVSGDLIKGTCTISGIFDLEPIRLSYLNRTLTLDAAEAARNSPLSLNYPPKTPLMMVVGDLESAEYQRQNHAMAARWRALGAPLDWVAPQGLNHFNLVNQLINPESDLVRAQLNVWAR